MRLDESTALTRLRAARVARLATADPAGVPHLVPVTFAVSTDGVPTVVIAIDHKPKTTTDLRRLRNIADNPRVSLLADHYDDEWTRLWWVRVDGTAEIRTGPAEIAEPVRLLSAKYVQYQQNPPSGPVIRIRVDAIRGWAYSA